MSAPRCRMNIDATVVLYWNLSTVRLLYHIAVAKYVAEGGEHANTNVHCCVILALVPIVQLWYPGNADVGRQHPS